MELLLIGTLIGAIATWMISGTFAGFLMVIGVVTGIAGLICAIAEINLGTYIGSRIGGFKRAMRQAREER